MRDQESEIAPTVYQDALVYLNQGKVSEAIASLKRSIQIDPNFEQAYQLSGDILQSQGSLVEAIAAFQKAITLNPASAATHNKLGVTFVMQGKLEDAIAVFRAAIAMQPEYAEAYYNFGLALVEQGQIDEAIEFFYKVLEIEPEHIDACLNLSTLLIQQQCPEAAIACLQDILSLQPECAEAYFNLSSAFLLQEDDIEAVECLEIAIAIQPGYVEAYFRLGTIFSNQNRLDEVINCFLKVVEIQPDYVEAHFRLGYVLYLQERFDEAINCFLNVVELNPNYVEAHYILAAILIGQSKLDEAIVCCQRTIELKPEHVGAHYLYAEALALQGKAEEALGYYQKVLELAPDHATAYRESQLILPTLYRNKAEITWWRQRFTQGLQNLIERVCLDTEEGRRWALDAIGKSVNFLLTYQGMNDVELQAQYGQLVHRIMVANYPQYSQEIVTKSQKSELNETSQIHQKIRIGYLSSQFYNHSVARAILGWLEHSDRHSFEIYSYHTGKTSDHITEKFQANSTIYRHINGSTEAICKQVTADKLDILIFADIGLTAHLTQIASLRLAPFQCTCWGHPITSGLPTIDYYLSSDLMEPEDHLVAQSHYTEKLVRLPKLGVSFPKIGLPENRKGRSDFKLSEQSVVYLCCQSLFKYLPQHDYIFAQIAQRLPHACFVFVARPLKSYLVEQFQLRLHRAFNHLGLDSQKHCVMLPHMEMDDYLSLCSLSDVFLDTIGFSGGCTTLDAIACNIPVVTIPGEFMRGRHAYAMLQILGVTDTIASNEEDYIELAVKLGLDRNWRQEIAEHMSSCHDNLYEDKTCVTALEDFFRNLVKHR